MFEQLLNYVTSNIEVFVCTVKNLTTKKNNVESQITYLTQDNGFNLQKTQKLNAPIKRDNVGLPFLDLQ